MRSPAAPEGPVESGFERRAARAEALAQGSRTAEAPLRFAAGLFRAQRRLARAIETAHARKALSGQLERDLDGFQDAMVHLLHLAADTGPQALAAEARARRGDERSVARSRLLVLWSGDHEWSETHYLSRAMLRPYLEVLRRLRTSPDRVHRPERCPFCGGLPSIAARRSESQADGARRVLGCALCGEEWLFGRIRCPCCFEEDPTKLPAFGSETHSSVRIEACDTCHRYVKSIDLTVDARAIPEVDDLLSLAMDLWAREQGYVRIAPGLAGL